MVQTGLGFTSQKSTKSTKAAERKTKQIKKLIYLLNSKQKSLEQIISLFAYLVGEPVCGGFKAKKKNISLSNSADSTSSLLTDCE